MSERRPPHFLLVEDNPDHAELIKQTLSKREGSNKLTHLKDGETALRYLRREGEYVEALLPDAVLLDLNLPGLSGLDVLKKIKEDSRLLNIPVIVLTTSGAESDRIKAYQLKVNSYLVKPLDFEKFQRMVYDIGVYWGMWNRTPPE